MIVMRRNKTTRFALVLSSSEYFVTRCVPHARAPEFLIMRCTLRWTRPLPTPKTQRESSWANLSSWPLQQRLKTRLEYEMRRDEHRFMTCRIFPRFFLGRKKEANKSQSFAARATSSLRDAGSHNQHTCRSVSLETTAGSMEICTTVAQPVEGAIPIAQRLRHHVSADRDTHIIRVPIPLLLRKINAHLFLESACCAYRSKLLACPALQTYSSSSRRETVGA